MEPSCVLDVLAVPSDLSPQVSTFVQHAVSSDPYNQPEIVPNYFQDEFDLELLVEAVKFARKATATDAWKAVSEAEVIPGPSADTDEKLRGSSFPTTALISYRSRLTRILSFRACALKPLDELAYVIH